jgi:hypothetical protein
VAARLLAMGLLALCAATLAALGQWGRTSAEVLAPAYLEEEDRERRAAVVRRGGTACYAGALAMAVAAVLAVV